MPKLPHIKDKEYWDLIKLWAEKYGSDGCTGVPDFYVQACWEHDYHHRYGETMFGDPITFDQTNKRFRKVIRILVNKNLTWNPKTWLNIIGFPMSDWRWVAVVSPAGKKLWDEHRREGLRRPIL